MNHNLKFFDVCAGIGSAHLAFKNLGCICIGYSEIDKKAETVYENFYGDSYKNYGDLMRIDLNKLDNFDFLLAGFPCQAFSIVGKRRGFEDKRGQIIYGISEIIKGKKPKAFVLENVKGLININNGKVLKEILMLLEKDGYQVFWKVLESSDFGIPQARERVYFVGIRDDVYNGKFCFPNNSEKKASLRSFLIDGDSRFILKKSLYQTFMKYLSNKYNKGKYDIEELLDQEYLVLDTRQSDLRLYCNKIPTLRTGRQGILYVKNKTIRKLSGLEALLLQGFDLRKAKKAQKNFAQTTILAQAGNAMTVNVMQEIGNSILKYLA
ncbi:MAG: DNA (cytosine-5-)-methyltransferase [Rickettsiales bacterium]|nr:DNA (cytosine-5-)-methyltransferase [Rickettsiales bacterium]